MYDYLWSILKAKIKNYKHSVLCKVIEVIIGLRHCAADCCFISLWSKAVSNYFVFISLQLGRLSTSNFCIWTIKLLKWLSNYLYENLLTRKWYSFISLMVRCEEMERPPPPRTFMIIVCLWRFGLFLPQKS